MESFFNDTQIAIAYPKTVVLYGLYKGEKKPEVKN